MKVRALLAWQWQGYPRYHQARDNLLLHIVVVPVFLLGSVGLLAAALQRSWLSVGLAALAMVASMACQGMGHGRERVPPEPFDGPWNACLRLLCEQWITFPRFVASGGWWRAWRAATAGEPKPV